MTSAEARTNLEGYVSILKRKLRGVAKGLWRVEAWEDPQRMVATPDRFICVTSHGDDWIHANFIAFSHLAVPALLALIEGALDQYTKTMERTFPNDPDMTHARREEAGLFLIGMAEDMAPHFKEVK